jgi:hypothetical protein
MPYSPSQDQGLNFGASSSADEGSKPLATASQHDTSGACAAATDPWSVAQRAAPRPPKRARRPGQGRA